jgi:hypothetical protein
MRNGRHMADVVAMPSADRALPQTTRLGISKTECDYYSSNKQFFAPCDSNCQLGEMKERRVRRGLG